MTMPKLAMIGPGDAVSGLRALGVEVKPTNDARVAAATLRDLGESEDYAVIFVAEELASGLGPELAKLRHRTLPVVLVVPTTGKGKGQGLARLRHMVEQAVGADILFKGEGK